MSTIPERSNDELRTEGGGPALTLALASAVGALTAWILLPSLVPGLAATLMGSSPKAYWYLSRGLGLASIGLLWISMVLGLLITDRLSRSWPGAAAAFALHEYTSLLGLVFALFHAAVLLGDKYVHYEVLDLVVPFAASAYRPIWVGLGQVTFYVWIPLALSFYIRRTISHATWKLIHYASFGVFMIAIMHGIAAGTDTSAAWMQAAYWLMGGSVLFLTAYRVVASLAAPERRAEPASVTANSQDA